MGGGIDKCLRGVNMLHAQIYIKKHLKTENIVPSKGGGRHSAGEGGGLPPRMCVKIPLFISIC